MIGRMNMLMTCFFTLFLVFGMGHEVLFCCNMTTCSHEMR